MAIVEPKTNGRLKNRGVFGGLKALRWPLWALLHISRTPISAFLDPYIDRLRKGVNYGVLYLSRSVSVPLYQKTFYVPIFSYVKHTCSVEPHSKLRGVKRLRTSHVTSAQLPRHAQWRPRHLPVSHDCASHLPHDGATNSLLESCWSDGSIPLIEGEGLSHRPDESCPTL